VLHGVPVGAGAHDDANLNLHNIEFYLNLPRAAKNDECYG